MRAITGGSPWRSAAVSRDAGPCSARSTVGRPCPGTDPPPTADSPVTRRTGTPRSSSFTDHSAARRRMSSTGALSMRSTGISSGLPESRCRSVASSAASVSLSMRTARASGCFASFRAPLRRGRGRYRPGGRPSSLSPEKVTTSQCAHRVGDRRLVGDRLDGPAAEVVDEQHPAGAGDDGQLVQRGRLGEAADPVVGRMHAQEGRRPAP